MDDCVNTYHSSIGRDETFTPPLVNSTNNGQSPIPHAIAMTTKHKSQDGGDDGHRELSVELEKLVSFRGRLFRQLLSVGLISRFQQSFLIHKYCNVTKVFPNNRSTKIS